MKKINQKILASLLKDDYFISNYKSICIVDNIIYVNYSLYTIQYVYMSCCGWAFRINGQVLYGETKRHITIIDHKLEGKYYLGDKNND